MDAADKRMLEREALRNMIQQWNANRLDLFELSEPNENLEFHGVMRFYFQDSGQKIATKCIRVASDATVTDVIETLIEKFRPDMRMLSVGQYSLWETHGPRDERRLAPHEKPLLVQLNWHADDREGRFLLKCGADPALSSANEAGDQNFKRKLSKREKKELKKKEKLSRLKSDANNENKTAEKLYTEMPETVFTRSISNPEAVMRRRRQQKLERKLQQFRATDGGPDTGGTLKIYGSSLCPDVPYKTLLVSVWDAAGGVLREMLDKYGLANGDPADYCLVQVDSTDNSEYVLEDDECPLAIVMTHPRRSSIMFHVRRRPADAQPRRRKKKVGGGGGGGTPRPGTEPALLEVTPEGAPLENGRRVRVADVIEVGSGNGTALQLYGPSIQPRHCVIAPDGGGSAYTITPLHPDAACYVNGQQVTHTQRLQHGCLLKFGRVSTYRFVDPTQETILNRNLSQSQHFGSGSIYDRSPREAGTMSPDHLDVTNANTTDTDQFQRTMSPLSHDTYGYNPNETMSPYNNNNTLKLDNESIMMSEHMNSKDDYMRDDNTGSVYNEQEQSGPRPAAGTNYKDNYETTFDIDGNVETKSICSAKSTGSGHDNRMSATVPASRPGQEAILPAVLEFGEAGQAQFLSAVITRLDPHAPAFKLAPVYTLYLCARYRASTHYRPELTPKERAHKLTVFLHHVATLIHSTVQERCTDSAAQAFWMANASELLHFLKCDRHISSFSTQAQDLLPTTVQNAFSNLVSCFQEELRGALIALCVGVGDATEATAPTLQALAAAMVLLRRCRVNAALTIQLFSHLFHYINATAFNKLVTSSGSGGAEAAWGAALSARLALLAAWAERQGLELAADCHLARTHQAARLIQGEYRTPEEVRSALASCFKLNSVQVRALLSGRSSAAAVEAGVAHARALADELYRADGREITLEESEWLGVGLLIPGDGFSAEVVRGVPPGLAEFIAPLQRGGLCRLAHQPHAIGVWTVYMTGYGNTATRRPVEPRVHIIQLNKNSNGMGLSIVAAKGAGQSKLGIYIKSVVAGGAAAADGRLAAGDQLLSVDGHSLVGITQEKAAEYLVRTGPTVTLEVGKQGAVLHGLATLLHQPPYSSSPAAGNAGSGGRRASERDLPGRLAAEAVKASRSTPALHHAAAPATAAAALHQPPPRTPQQAESAAWAGKSRSSHNLSAPHDAFYQNLPALNDRWSSLRSSAGSRPQSAHFSPEHDAQAQQNNAAMAARNAKFAEMSEEVTRRQQHQQQMLQQQQQQQQMQQQMNYPMSPTKSPAMPHHGANIMSPLQIANPHMQMTSPNQVQPPMSATSPQMYQNHMQPQQQRYEWGAGPPSPLRAQPPVAPKPPNMRRPESEMEEQHLMSPTQPLSPHQINMSMNNVSNDDEWLVGSNGAGGTGGNPWQREAREREDEQRRAVAAQRRSATIAALVSLGAARSPQQSYQLRALQLEADFLRRADQHKQEEGTEPHSPESPEREPERIPDRMQERIPDRMQERIPDRMQERERIPDRMQERIPDRMQERAPERIPDRMQDRIPERVSERIPERGQQERPQEQERAPPKSILKSHKTDNMANGHSDNVSGMVSTVSASLSSLTVGGAGPAGGVAAPPPPERGSSFAVMAALGDHHTSPPLATLGRDKRVSFHGAPPPPPATSPPPDAPPPAPDTPHTPHTPPPAPDTPHPATHPAPHTPEDNTREDPDRFLEEASRLVVSGAAHTPGVIGAQEVYRDPRARRLAAQSAAAAAAAGAGDTLPEQMSFRDKMKMFALEAGDRHTPKDKVKISRAQRDIDAVH